MDLTVINSMIGKTYAYNNYVYYIKSTSINGESVEIFTDGKTMIFHSQPQLDFFIEDCKEVHLPANTQQRAVAPVNNFIEASVLDEVKNLLIQNIRQVKDDKEFIPQANAMAKQVNALVQLVQMEVNTSKAIHKGEI